MPPRYTAHAVHETPGPRRCPGAYRPSDKSRGLRSGHDSRPADAPAHTDRAEPAQAPRRGPGCAVRQLAAAWTSTGCCRARFLVNFIAALSMFIEHSDPHILHTVEPAASDSSL